MMKDVWDPQIPVEKSHYYNEEDPIAYRPSTPFISNGEPTLIDLFSGCGGISCGFEMAGFKTLLGVDIHSPSIASFRKNHPEAAAVLGDIAKVTEENVHSLIGDNSVTAISAGVPCQGFSISNRKRWQDDERNFLFKEFVRFVDMLRPKVIMLENVSGMRSTKNGQFVRDITQAMSNAGDGYIVESKLLNSADFGVPQSRRRLIFIGHLKKNSEQYKFSWPEPTHLSATDGQQCLWESKPKYVTVGDAFCDLPRIERGQSDNKYSLPASKASDFARLMRGSKRTFSNHEAGKGTQSTSDRVARTKQGEPMYPKFRQRIRLHMNRPSPTIVSGGIRPQFQLGHPIDARGLTVRERARIMSFPDSFIFMGGTVMGRVQTGQAVPPLLAKAVAEQMVRILPTLK
jgi:DNA (cytosine-5)-methyltransferase 1